MSLKVRCQCGKKYKVPEERAGQTTSCKACGSDITVPLALTREEPSKNIEPQSVSEPTRGDDPYAFDFNTIANFGEEAASPIPQAPASSPQEVTPLSKQEGTPPPLPDVDSPILAEDSYIPLKDASGEFPHKIIEEPIQEPDEKPNEATATYQVIPVAASPNDSVEIDDDADFAELDFDEYEDEQLDAGELDEEYQPGKSTVSGAAPITKKKPKEPKPKKRRQAKDDGPTFWGNLFYVIRYEPWDCLKLLALILTATTPFFLEPVGLLLFVALTVGLFLLFILPFMHADRQTGDQLPRWLRPFVVVLRPVYIILRPIASLYVQIFIAIFKAAVVDAILGGMGPGATSAMATENFADRRGAGSKDDAEMRQLPPERPLKETCWNCIKMSAQLSLLFSSIVTFGFYWSHRDQYSAGSQQGTRFDAISWFSNLPIFDSESEAAVRYINGIGGEMTGSFKEGFGVKLASLDLTDEQKRRLTKILGNESLPLQRIELIKVDVDDQLLRYVWRHIELKNVRIQNIPVETETFKFLTRMKELQTLDLSGTDVDDDIVPIIKKCRRLKYVNLQDTRLSKKALAELQNRAFQLEDRKPGVF